MKNVHYFAITIFALVICCCYGDEDVDDIEPNEYAFNLNSFTSDHINLKREKRRSARLRWHSYGYSTARNGGRSRKEARFRIRARYRPSFSRPLSAPHSAPSVRKPGVKASSAKPSFNRPSGNNPDVNKPGVVPFNGGNDAAQRPNPLLGNSNQGQAYNPNIYRPPPPYSPQGGQAYNPNIYRPPPAYPPPAGGQQPNQFSNNRPPQQSNQGNNNRPGMMPIPIPIPIPLGGFGRHNSAPNQHNENAHNESSHNQSALKRDVKGSSGSNRYECGEISKQLLFILINLYIVILYYVL